MKYYLFSPHLRESERAVPDRNLPAFHPEFDWGDWSRRNTSTFWKEGTYAIRESDNPYTPGTWAYEQWAAGYKAMANFDGATG